MTFFHAYQAGYLNMVSTIDFERELVYFPLISWGLCKKVVRAYALHSHLRPSGTNPLICRLIHSIVR